MAERTTLFLTVTRDSLRHSRQFIKGRRIEMGTTAEVAAGHWENYAAAFAQPLQSNGLVSRFVTNADVTGSYAEAWVRLMTHSMLGLKFRISTGAVIRPADAARGLAQVPQCDLIVWDPSELPGLFEAGDFALVPFASAQAVIEIKRSVPDIHKFREQLRRQARVIPSGRVLGVVVNHPTPLFEWECTPDWLKVVSDDAPMTRLLHGNEADTNGVMAFIYFLAQVAGHNSLIVQ
jgi:hypothetical protein